MTTMAHHTHEPARTGHAPLPDYLEGLEPPVTTDEALEHAEKRGAPPEALRFIESLPAAVFTSEEGMRHAFSALRHHEIPPTDPEAVLVGKDGTSS
jgi:hypothetical protein